MDSQLEQLLHSLTNQPPRDDSIVFRFEDIRSLAKTFGTSILINAPASRERSIAITKLEESVMWAIKAIALNQETVNQEAPS